MKKFLVIYFSRTGEEYNVGNITRGNTAIVADLIAQKLSADIFEIQPVEKYPDNYNDCIELAKKELASNARPAFAKNITNLVDYDTIFLGYPIWWGSLPCVVMTFLEHNDFSGKKIIPFCTHAGSGLAKTVHEITEFCPNAEIINGFAISGKVAQLDSSRTKSIVDDHLKQLELIK